MLMLDVAKAFDRVWHRGLIVKLYEMGIPKDFVLLINSYLMMRKFRIKLNGVYSNYRTIKAGVPQGSILGPTLYILFTSDFPINNEDPNQLTALYADDTAILCKSMNQDKALDKLQSILYDIEDWCTLWKTKLHPDKSQFIIIRRKKKSRLVNTIQLFNTTITPTTKRNI